MDETTRQAIRNLANSMINQSFVQLAIASDIVEMIPNANPNQLAIFRRKLEQSREIVNQMVQTWNEPNF